MDVVCDIDETLAHTLPLMCAAVNAKFGSKYTPEDITSYPLKDILKPDEWDWYHDEMKYDLDFMMSFPPYFDAIAALGVMQQAGYHITVATDRNDPDTTAATSKAWLEKNGVPHDEFISLGDDTKKQLAKQYHKSGKDVIFFDDDPRKCKFVPGDNAKLWLPRRPYTPVKVPRGCTIFDSWNTPLQSFGLRTFSGKSFSSSHRIGKRAKPDTFLL